MTNKTKVLKKSIPNAPTINGSVKLPSGWSLYGSGRNCGLSYSSISKFISCRERFRIRMVEGLVPGGSKEAMEFGTIFHTALEHSAGGSTASQISAHLQKISKPPRGRQKKNQPTPFDPLLCKIASAMIPKYQDFWKDHLKTIHYFETEKKFEFEYQCSIGRTIKLQGRRDEGYRKGGCIWLQENKTKGQISEDQIIQTLGYSLQPMLYLLSFKQDHPKEKLGGILYNVIRKPQMKKRKNDTDITYVQRIKDDIEERPDHYFKMYEIAIDDKHLEEWRLRYFDPILCQICLWWESIAHNPFDPWTLENGDPNPHHFLRPFGLFDPMSFGLGDYFVRVVNGVDAGLVRTTECFPELVKD